MPKNDFGSWIICGDEWIVSYLSSYPGLTFGTVERFSIAHAFEHYFKACLVKKHNPEYAINKNHNIYAMYQELKLDPAFLPDVTIEDKIYKAYSVEIDSMSSMSREMLLKVLEIQHLLLVFKYTSDLKYWRFKKATGPKSMATIYPDIRYAEILHQIRNYLNWDKEKNYDILHRIVDEGLWKTGPYLKSRIEFLKLVINGKE